MKDFQGSCFSPIVEQPAENNQKNRGAVASVLKAVNPFEMQDAIARAKRSKLDSAGRQRRIGAHVGMMVRQLLFWEQKGELEDYWIHKTAREWSTADASFTTRMLRTAERLAVEEGLMEVKGGFRPGDRQRTKFYRLNLWEVARVFVATELENIEQLLKHEGRKYRRDTLNRKRRGLETARDDLNLLYERDPAQPDPIGGVVTTSGEGDYKLTPLQEKPQSKSYVNTPSSLRSEEVFTPGTVPVRGHIQINKINAKTIALARDRGLDASPGQKESWGAGWKHALVDSHDPITVDDVDEVMEWILLAAGGELTDTGTHSRYFMTVDEAVRRFREPDISDSGSEPEDTSSKPPTSPGPGRQKRKQKLHVGADAGEAPPAEEKATEAREEKLAPAPAPAPPKKKPEAPKLSRDQTNRLSDMMRGKGGENILSRLAEHHLWNVQLGSHEGKPFTPERIAERAREEIAPELPVESFVGAIRRILNTMRVARELRAESTSEREKDVDEENPTREPSEPGEDYAGRPDSDFVGMGLGQATKRISERLSRPSSSG